MKQGMILSQNHSTYENQVHQLVVHHADAMTTKFSDRHSFGLVEVISSPAVMP